MVVECVTDAMLDSSDTRIVLVNIFWARNQYFLDIVKLLISYLSVSDSFVILINHGYFQSVAVKIQALRRTIAMHLGSAFVRSTMAENYVTAVLQVTTSILNVWVSGQYFSNTGPHVLFHVFESFEMKSDSSCARELFVVSACNCDTYGSYGITCDQNGQCPCRPTFMGLTCDKCRPNFYNYPNCEGTVI